MKNCVFCGISAGRVPASVVHEDELVTALITINPANPGHTLVVPRKHVTNLADLGDRLGTHLFKVTVIVAEAVKKSGVRCEGIDLFLSSGEPQQKILHLHMHVVPRFQGDGLNIDLGRVRPTRTELDETASLIRRAYDLLGSKTKGS
jgi:histidine triad (HIT) family protein